MVIDGSNESSRRLQAMLFWDVNNGVARRSWGRNEGAIFAIKRAMETEPLLKVTIPNIVADNLFDF
jgi:urocanate hydratase